MVVSFDFYFLFKYFIFTKYEPRINIMDIYIVSFVLCFSYCIMEFMFCFSLFQNLDYYGIGMYSPFFPIFFYTRFALPNLVWAIKYVTYVVSKKKIELVIWRKKNPTFFFIVAFNSVQFGLRLKFSVVQQFFEISYLQLCTISFGGKIKISSFRIILEFIEKDMCTIKGLIFFKWFFE